MKEGVQQKREEKKEEKERGMTDMSRVELKDDSWASKQGEEVVE